MLPTNPCRRRPSSLLAALFLVLLAVAFQPVAAARKRTVTLFQDPPTIDEVVDGDIKIYQYYATLRTAKGGAVVGTLFGQTTFNKALFTGAAMETRTRQLVFEFTGSAKDKVAPLGQVTASGVVSYTDNSFFLQAGRPVTIPVTGGSQGWFGASGQVTSTRLNDAGEHTHTFEITASNRKSKWTAP